MKSGQTTKNMLGVADAKGYIFVALDDILYLKADNSYTEIHTRDGRILMASRLLKYFEKELWSAQFIRIHQSYVINTSHLLRYCNRESNSVTLNSGHVIPVSRSRKKMFMESFIRA